MRVSESWLREWVDPGMSTDELGERLTMLGHEVDGVETSGAGLDGVIVGEVVAVDAHPDADKLRVCRVTTGDEEVDVVCGAPNVVAGMKSPLALPGTRLPNGVKLRKSKIRGVVSGGMLCSAVELGLGAESDGILELPAEVATGAALSEALGLPDTVFDLNITPNRGDCFSVLGIARDLAALSAAALRDPVVSPVEPGCKAAYTLEIADPSHCPNFAGRVVRGIDSAARTPLWMVERLRRAGLRAIHPVVDITNYVMLEFGQPLHAYDVAALDGPIRPRLGNKGERCELLDGRTVDVDDETLVISDDSGVIGLAGIMGGAGTMVNAGTRDVYFEAAYWPPALMAGKARRYGLHTDASMRFERGVDPQGQARAVERATALLQSIAGGEAGPLDLETDIEQMPDRAPIVLRRARLERLLGTSLDDATVTGLLARLGMAVEPSGDGWVATPPSWRFDLAIEADLIEEVARLYGYDEIPEQTEVASLPLRPVTETEVPAELAAATLIARDYREVVTYSFVDARADEVVTGEATHIVLANPISAELSVMRGSLWPGMLQAAASNLARQQERVRLFEIGTTFHGSLDAHREVVRIGALATGPAAPEQWGDDGRRVDFFDIKSDIEALLALGGDGREIAFEAAEHPALQPGQCASVLVDGAKAGIVGKLHPAVARHFELKPAVFVFELDATKSLYSAVPAAAAVSKFPAIRRDIAVLVNESVSAADLIREVRAAVGALVQEVRIFDVYQGPGIEAGLKSVALGLILQETSRTLTDEDADTTTAAAVTRLQQKFAAQLRD